MKPSFFNLKVADIKQETSDAVSIAIEVTEDIKSKFNYKSGQYITFKTAIEGEEVRRSYSLCSSPTESEWRVAVKKIENGKFSTYANDVLKIGDEVEVMSPMGNFILPENLENKSFVFYASGSGITPVFSMIKTILSESSTAQATLVYGNKGFNSIIFREELETLKNLHMERFRVIHVLSRESLGNDIQAGRIDKLKANAIIKSLVSIDETDGVFICGPESMILGVKEAYTDLGLDAKNIHFELFGTVTKAVEQVVSDEVITSRVKVILDGEEFDINLASNDKNILDAALEAGADLPFACKGGVCCTCKGKILEGSAKMTVNYALEPDEVEAGYVLTCQAHPTSEKLTVSFDD
jgi:ring-1,2-phenylacetyl-CoA epoxidase subunit PaaE